MHLETLGGASLRIHEVVKRFAGGAPAVDAVSLTVEPGEFLTLLGPSGSGKTTTLNMIAGFITPDSGSIFLDDQDIAELAVHRRGIGMVFQQFSLFPHMNVAANVGFPLRERRMPKADVQRRVAEVLEAVNLAAFAERMPHELSGGQQQRVALARAIVFEPRLLLMDEPLGALDKKLREHLQIEIKRIQRELGITCIFVTHDQEEALLMSDRIAVFNEGKVVQVATPGDLYERPASRFVAEFVGDSNIFTGTLATRAGGARLRCAEGDLPVATPAAGRDGDLDVLVRPEVIEIAAPGAASACLTGEVIESDYFGASTKSLVRTPSGRTVRVRQDRSRGAVLTVGDEVSLSWRAEDTHVL